jgi:hypothetical protein
MKKRFFLFAFLILQFSCELFAQEKKEAQLLYRPIFQQGIVTGQTVTALQMQLINGISYKLFFAGAGVGLDYYYERSVPIFLDLRVKIFNKAASPFVYADGGYSFLWQKEKDASQVDSDGGLFYELGIGYEVTVNKKIKILLAGGYSYKALSKTMNEMPWLSAWPPPKEAIRNYDYSLQRISVKAGFSF